jgi:hypothetical protein
MVVRCTRRVLDLLGPDKLAEPEPGDDDWYLNLLWLERRKCLLLTHAGSLFASFVPDRRTAQLRPLSGLLVPLIETELSDEGLPANTLGSLDRDSIVVAKTASRHVLGVMNDIALYCRYAIDAAGGLDRCDSRRQTASSAVGCTRRAATTCARSSSRGSAQPPHSRRLQRLVRLPLRVP